MIITKFGTFLAVSTFLTGCAVTDTTFSFLGPEIGTELDRGNFGVATANNIGIQSGELTTQMVMNLTRKFASESTPTINFAFDSARLDASSKAALRQQAAWIIGHPGIIFRVYGHTDKVGSESYNYNLGRQRARVAVNYLVSQGVNRSSVEAVASFGETRPLVITEDRNRQNRRTVTEVSGFAPNANGNLDGKYAQQIYNTYISGGSIVKNDLHCCYSERAAN
jgi:peptidoglycan-associated lipoprotein